MSFVLLLFLFWTSENKNSGTGPGQAWSDYNSMGRAWLGPKIACTASGVSPMDPARRDVHFPPHNIHFGHKFSSVTVSLTFTPLDDVLWLREYAQKIRLDETHLLSYTSYIFDRNLPCK